jgi:hypothetical protein
MKRLQLAIVAALTIHSAAFAQTGADSTAAGRALGNRAMYSLMRPQTFGRIVRNGNECAPEAAAPVWSADAALLGYSCTAASANGG